MVSTETDAQGIVSDTPLPCQQREQLMVREWTFSVAQVKSLSHPVLNLLLLLLQAPEHIIVPDR